MDNKKYINIAALYGEIEKNIKKRFCQNYWN